jgi:hypothetical protein
MARHKINNGRGRERARKEERSKLPQWQRGKKKDWKKAGEKRSLSNRLERVGAACARARCGDCPKCEGQRPREEKTAKMRKTAAKGLWEKENNKTCKTQRK